MRVGVGMRVSMLWGLSRFWCSMVVAFEKTNTTHEYDAKDQGGKQ